MSSKHFVRQIFSFLCFFLLLFTVESPIMQNKSQGDIVSIHPIIVVVSALLITEVNG